MAETQHCSTDRDISISACVRVCSLEKQFKTLYTQTHTMAVKRDFPIQLAWLILGQSEAGEHGELSRHWENRQTPQTQRALEAVGMELAPYSQNSTDRRGSCADVVQQRPLVLWLPDYIHLVIGMTCSHRLTASHPTLSWVVDASSKFSWRFFSFFALYFIAGVLHHRHKN